MDETDKDRKAQFLQSTDQDGFDTIVASAGSLVGEQGEFLASESPAKSGSSKRKKSRKHKSRSKLSTSKITPIAENEVSHFPVPSADVMQQEVISGTDTGGQPQPQSPNTVPAAPPSHQSQPDVTNCLERQSDATQSSSPAGLQDGSDSVPPQSLPSQETPVSDGSVRNRLKSRRRSSLLNLTLHQVSPNVSKCREF
ncbi:hypothetical protein BaRGS_00005631 [Batillaria attramentaria]|uniref:Uncharacterized protein n=1 Tax=Batillaria attramentaria TaxID=370345 RepID=A0ABD0LU04_9CAEN